MDVSGWELALDVAWGSVSVGVVIPDSLGLHRTPGSCAGRSEHDTG